MNREYIYNACRDHLSNQIDSLNKLIEQAQEAANNETKSSAGDKYETGRAMMQAEKDRLAVQLNDKISNMRVLDSISISSISEQVQLGSIVVTEVNTFFIGPALGQIKTEKGHFFAISPNSPLALELLNKKKGASFFINNQEFTILDLA